MCVSPEKNKIMIYHSFIQTWQLDCEKLAREFRLYMDFDILTVPLSAWEPGADPGIGVRGGGGPNVDRSKEGPGVLPPEILMIGKRKILHSRVS